MHGDKTQLLKKCPPEKINGKKNVLFFVSRALPHHSFTFNLRFLHDLKHKIRLSKTVLGILHFRFNFVFLKLIFLFKKCMDSLTLKRHDSF